MSCKPADQLWMQREITEWLRLKIANKSSYTQMFVEQIARHMSREGEVLGGRWHHFHVHSIYDALAELEDGSVPPRTKPHSEFTGSLKGLWHKHFGGAAFLARNLGSEVEKHGHQLIRQMYPEDLRIHGLNEEQDGQRGSPVLLHTLVMGAHENRSRRTASGSDKGFTGEWIVYAQTGDRRIFLTLGTHEEKEGDILKRIMPSLVEFPQLRRISCLVKL